METTSANTTGAGENTEDDGGATGAEPSTEPAPDDAELVSRLRVIEDQPLDTRAAAFAHLHDGLRATLEGGDGPRRPQ